MKKLIIITVCMAILAVMIGCKSNANVTPSNAPPLDASTPEPTPLPTAPVDSAPEPVHAGQKFENSDGILEITVSSTQTADMQRDIIEVPVSIKNIGSEAVAYVQGSGSNTVPEALVVDFDGLAETYKPIMMTMDYQTHLLQPGETLSYTLTFAPFRYVGDEEFPMPVPPGSGLEYFEDNEYFAPVMPGQIEGLASFRYYLPAEDMAEAEPNSFNFVQDGEDHTLSVEFDVYIGEYE